LSNSKQIKLKTKRKKQPYKKNTRKKEMVYTLYMQFNISGTSLLIQQDVGKDCGYKPRKGKKAILDTITTISTATTKFDVY
jgi:hypothetical protein